MMERMNKYLNKTDLYFLAVVITIVCYFAVSIATTLKDSPTVDENAHIGAAYSYVANNDYRMNPEHPPIIKWLAGAGVAARVGTDIAPPNQPYENLWHYEQHNFGHKVIYGQQTSAQSILLAARLPIIALNVILIVVLYLTVAKIWNKPVALLAVLLLTANPTFIAHSRLVTTDTIAMWGSFFSLVALVWWLKDPPSYKKAAIFGLIGGGALLSKFNCAATIVYAFLFTIAYLLVKPHRLAAVALRGSMALIIMAAVVYVAYIPAAVSIKDPAWLDNTFFLNDKTKATKSFIGKLYSSTITRPYSIYAQGFARVQERYEAGDKTFLFGKTYNGKVYQYYPVVSLAKTPPALLMLTFAAVTTSLLAWAKTKHRYDKNKILRFLKDNEYDIALLGFAAVYTLFAITGFLNLGIRYLMPVLLPTVLCLARLVLFVWRYYKTLAVRIPIAILIAGYLLTPVVAYPNYVAYTNTLFGGTLNAYKSFNDSNVDWGQDLQRLAAWAQQHPEINRLYVSSFGWGDWQYYFCQKDTNNGQCNDDKYVWWTEDIGQPPAGTYMAVSTTPMDYQLGLEKAGQPPEFNLSFLKDRKPYANINGSILIFKF